MPIELTAHTDAGARLVTIAKEPSEELASRPLGANRAYDYLAQVALGEQPALH